MKKLLICAMAAACLFSARAAITVGPSGSGVYPFSSTPAATEFSTGVLNGDGLTYADIATLDGGVNTRAASTIVRTLPTSGTVPPSTFSGGFRHNTAGLYLQSRPTTDGTNAANLLLATLQNTSGSAISAITISYSFNLFNLNATDELQGFRVYYSLDGAAGNWQPINALSTNTTAGTHSATVSIGNWPNNGTMYLLWADDNSGAGTDTSYTIDDFSVVQQGVNVPLAATLVTPTNGSVFVAPATVPVTVTTVGTTPATSVTFYTNNVQYAVVSGSSPYNAPLSGLPVGTYAVYARAVNASETALTATNTITVRPEFVSYTGGTITEIFDSMGEFGRRTPAGWYFGAALPATSIDVTPTNGMMAPSGAILGFNFGNIGSAERALGTEPTGGDRNMVLRLRNDASSNIVSFEIRFDGEVWRTYTNAVDGWLTNFVSFDLGSNWIATGFNFEQPTPRVEPTTAVDGNDPLNRTAAIGGVVTVPSPVPPGGVIYIRWQDINGAGVTDGGLAIDNFSFTASFEQFQPFVIITSPTNGATFAESAPITINASASMNNPITNVAFFRDGILVGNDMTAPYSAVYSNSTAGTHTLTATARDSAGNAISTTNLVTINVAPNVPPTVTLTNPANGSVYFVGVTVTNVSASATDSDGSIARVEFYLDNVLFATDTTVPYAFDLGDITAGAHTLAAVAVDNAGSHATNSISISATNPPDISVIVPNGSDWKYLDNGSDQGTAWHALAFDDSGWSSGLAELGYGDAPGRPERTTVGFGGNAGAKFATTYFRKRFVANPTGLTNLILNVLRDDHAVVYLNGTQVYSDMTNAVITFATYEGPAAPDDGTVYQVTNAAPGLLLAGTNILAVEIHQDSGTSSDISFDLMLWGQGASVGTGPALQIVQTDETHARVTWPNSASGYVLQGNMDLNTTNWVTIPGPYPTAGSSFSTNVVTSGTMKYFRLKQ